MILKAYRFSQLARNARLSSDGLLAMQSRRLRRLVHHAWDSVPFYRELWARHGVGPDDVRTPSDLGRLPVVTKEELRRAGEGAWARGVRASRCVPVWTSGTEGEPFTVLITPAEARVRRLVNFRVLRSMGVRPADRIVMLGPIQHRTPTALERLGVYRTWVVPGDLPLDEQIERVVSARPTVLWSYPGPLHAILHHSEYRLSRLVRPRMVITSGGALLPTLAGRLGEDLGCELFDSYGCMEVGRLAAECRDHLGLHVQADQVILEEGGCGGNVATALNQLAMPLIRYRLGDLSPAAEGQCSCGSAFPRIERVEGRADDMLRLPSGRLLSPWAPQSALIDVAGIRQFLFVQDRADHLKLLLSVESGWGPGRTEAVRRRLAAVMEEPIEIEITLVRDIPRRGAKHRSVVSLVGERM